MGAPDPSIEPGLGIGKISHYLRQCLRPPRSRGSRRRIDHRVGMSIFREILDGRAFRRDSLKFMLNIGQSRDVIRFRVGLSEVTLVNHPDLIRRVLVTDAPSYGEGKWTLRGKHIMRDCLITREGPPHRERRGSSDRHLIAEGLRSSVPPRQHHVQEMKLGQILVALATIARRWRLLPAPGLDINPTRQTPGLRMVLERRSEC